MAKPMFSKQHYEALAATLMGTRPLRYKQEFPGLESSMTIQWEEVVLEIVSMLLADNPKFDNERFLKACGAD